MFFIGCLFSEKPPLPCRFLFELRVFVGMMFFARKLSSLKKFRVFVFMVSFAGEEEEEESRTEEEGVREVEVGRTRRS